MNLLELVGPHLLSAIEFSANQGDATVLRFTLDGVTFAASEDPDDGYRSCLGELAVSAERLANSFPPIPVLAVQSAEELLEFYDARNGGLLLVLGTDTSDDYYPLFVASWTPENAVHFR